MDGFVNFDIFGSEEGAWLYGAYKWGREPVLSVGVAANYSPPATRPVDTADSRNFPFTSSLANVAFKSLLVHWNVLF